MEDMLRYAKANISKAKFFVILQFNRKILHDTMDNLVKRELKVSKRFMLTNVQTGNVIFSLSTNFISFNDVSIVPNSDYQKLLLNLSIVINVIRITFI